MLSEYAPSLITCCEQSDRYDLNHISAESVIPNDVSSLCSKILWSTVSNAVRMSSRTNNVTCHLQLLKVPFLCCVAFCMQTAVGDTNHSQPGDYVIGQKLLSLLLLIETADCLRALDSYKPFQDQGFLTRRLTRASFHASGKTPCDSEQLTMVVITGSNWSRQSTTNWVGNGSK